MDNAARHAGPARVCVRAWDTAGALHFTVCDTGCGFDPSRTPAGAGLTNMRDRITALGGTLTFDSSPSHGMRLYGSVPEPWPDTVTPRRSLAAGASGVGARAEPDDEETSSFQQGSR